MKTELLFHLLLLCCFFAICLAEVDVDSLSSNSLHSTSSRNTAFLEQSRTLTRFDTHEHTVLVHEGWDAARKNIKEISAVSLMKFNDKAAVGIGSAAAYWGDLFGVAAPGAPLCDRSLADLQSWVDHTAATASSTLTNNLEKINKRQQGLTSAKARELADEFDQDYARVSQLTSPNDPILDGIRVPGGYTKDVLMKKSAYIEYAKNNFDHFGFAVGAEEPCNKRAYQHLHLLAYQTYQKALKLLNTGQALQEAIQKALRYETAALHFFTDRFAAGHMRVPRKQVPAACIVEAAGHGLTKCQHDEENHHGLKVSNAKGEKWTAYGDGFFGEKGNEKNKEIATHAVTLSFTEVFTKSDAAEPAYAAEQLVPVVEQDNTPSMFSVDSKGHATVRAPFFTSEGSIPKKVKYVPLKDENCVGLFIACMKFYPAVAQLMSDQLAAKIKLNDWAADVELGIDKATNVVSSHVGEMVDEVAKGFEAFGASIKKVADDAEKALTPKKK